MVRVRVSLVQYSLGFSGLGCLGSVSSSGPEAFLFKVSGTYG